MCKFSIYLTLFCIFYCFVLFSQENNKNESHINGNFELNTQYYQDDSIIGAKQPPEDIGLNSYLNLIFTKGNFEAGIRYESYQNALLGYSRQFKGNGITYRYAKYTEYKIEFTVGNIYEQFGNGQILRTYFNPGFGIDNSIDGIRVKYNNMGINIKIIAGKQRNYFTFGEGIVRGGDISLDINSLFPSLNSNPLRLTLGASAVSKYQADNNTQYTLPENVLASGGRFNLNYKNFNLNGEYTLKNNDPSADNNYSYRKGQAYFISSSYFNRGFGITLSAKTIDNMFFRSDRNNSSIFPELYINFIPTLTKQHTYNLMATLYPYAIQFAGEISYQADVIYKFKKNTFLGGKYGTSIQVNYSFAANIDTVSVGDEFTTRQIYKTNLFKSREKYWHDFNIEITKKFSKKLKGKFTYQNLYFNQDVIQGEEDYPVVLANVGVIDILYKIDKKNAIRTELQGLFTKQDRKDWGTIVIEYTKSPHWFIGLQDQYNFGNDKEEEKNHYIALNIGYINRGNRITIGYGRQRAGIFCVGGVCRVVPASSGLTLSVTSRF